MKVGITNTRQRSVRSRKGIDELHFLMRAMGFELDWTEPAGKFCHNFLMIEMAPCQVVLQSRINSTNCFMSDM